MSPYDARQYLIAVNAVAHRNKLGATYYRILDDGSALVQEVDQPQRQFVLSAQDVTDIADAADGRLADSPIWEEKLYSPSPWLVAAGLLIALACAAYAVWRL